MVVVFGRPFDRSMNVDPRLTSFSRRIDNEDPRD